MATGPYEINGKCFTRTLNASEHVGHLIAEINGLLNNRARPDRDDEVAG